MPRGIAVVVERMGWALLLVLLAVAAGCNRSRSCASNADCPIGASCAASGDCEVATCAVDRDCPLGAVCESQQCAPGCRDGLDCPGSVPICDRSGDGAGVCVACRDQADCPTGFSCVDRTCRQSCRDDSNCASGHCDAGSRWCVDCTDDSHCGAGTVCADQACVAGCDDDRRCPADAPRCLPDRGDHGVCAQCRGDADCPAGVCSRDGTCVDPAAPDAATSTADAGADAASSTADASTTIDAVLPAVTALDVLFVIDNSFGMGAKQDVLIAAFPAFIADLEQRLGHRPDLHVGVISTDLGGPASFSCGAGDGGRLQATARVSGCPAPTGAFLRDVAAAGGGRDTNFAGTLDGAFGCIAELGELGCSFEQPLGALIRAVDGSVAGNAGFLRSQAALAVIILSDEDDCTATSPVLFETDTTRLGPQTSFRCFAQGVRCSPDSPATVGAKTGCVPRPGNAYTAVPEVYAAALRAVKPAGRIAVAVVAGPPTPVSVSEDSNSVPPRPTLDSSCSDIFGLRAADPAVRLSAFAGLFGNRGSFASTCSTSQDAPMRTFSAMVVAMLQGA